VLDPTLSVSEPWLKIFLAFYVLVGIGILVEVARRLGMGFIASREQIEAEKAAKKAAKSTSG
jgi:putative exporter of polyketide antibiotics